MTNKKLLLRTILLLLLSPLALAAKIHAIIAIDTASETMEWAMEYNVGLWRDMFVDLQRVTGVEVQQIYFVGDDLTWKNVKEYITSLSVGSQDTLFFYSSAHGTRTAVNISPWPDLDWSTELVAIGSAEIMDLLREKQAQLLVLITEACNRSSNWDEVFSIPMAVTREGSPELKKGNYLKLFVETKGEIIATSAAPGELSWFWPMSGGGFFTKSFMKSLREVVNGRSISVDWVTVMDRTAKDLLRSCKGHAVQHPVYQITLSE